MTRGAAGVRVGCVEIDGAAAVQRENSARAADAVAPRGAEGVGCAGRGVVEDHAAGANAGGLDRDVRVGAGVVERDSHRHS